MREGKKEREKERRGAKEMRKRECVCVCVCTCVCVKGELGGVYLRGKVFNSSSFHHETLQCQDILAFWN